MVFQFVVEAAGGRALPCIVDVRDEAQVRSAVQQAVEKFNGIDILVNNASAISLTPTEKTDMKRYDLMHSINTRGTFLVSKECLPYLRKSKNAHILNISPPLNMAPHWFGPHVAYTMAKYGMSMCVLGMAHEYKDAGVAVNALWPRTAIATAAMELLSGGEDNSSYRKPEIMADAAYEIFKRDPKKCTGNFFIDDEVLKSAGVNDMLQYACDPTKADQLMPDFFLDLTADELRVAQQVAGPLSEMYGSLSVAYGSAGTKAAEEAAVGEVAALFKKIESMLSEELVKKVGCTFQFNVKGDEAGTWFLDLKTGAGQLGQGDAANGADAILTMDSKHFAAMFAGKLKPANAFMTGKLKISGDLQKAMKLEKLMGSLKAKL